MSTDSFEELQARYVAGAELSTEETNRLLRWLNENLDSRQEMLLDGAMDSQLRCLVRLDDEESTEEFIQDTVQRAVAPPRNENFPIAIQVDEENSSRPFQLFSMSAALCAAALISVGIGIVWYASMGRPLGDFGFAQIINSENLSWELIDAESRRLRVSSGRGEVRFENGTTAQLIAPVVVELRDLGDLFVKTGSVEIDVPPAAVGFTVHTPLARIVDYGTRFDVNVGNSGQTDTRVRSGIVTFETRFTGLSQSDPIRLSAEGLNRASARESPLSRDVRSIVTTANGSGGQFFGTIHADGNTVEFGTRREFDDFQNRLSSVWDSNKNPPPPREQRSVTAQSSAKNASSQAESSSEGSGHGFSGGRAQKMLIEQLRSMQQNHPENTQMQELLEGMILQVEETQK